MGTFIQEIGLMSTYIHRVFIFEWVTFIKESDLTGTNIHRVPRAA